MFHRAWLEINTRAFTSNLRHLREAADPASLLAVLKADAYGLGAVPLARAAMEAGAKRIGVATANEALALAPLGFPIQVMSALFPEELPPLIDAGIEIPLHDYPMAGAISEAAHLVGRRARIHVKLDTGMGRLGLFPEDLEAVADIRHKFHNIDIVGIFTHFPRSTEHEAEYCRGQIAAMKKALAFFEGKGITFQTIHIANSDAICHLPETAKPPFNMVRAGLAMHGLVDNGESRPKWLKEVASFRARLVSVRTLPAGHAIGYSATHVLKQPTRIGTIAAGYADGIPLALSNSCDVLVRGHRCPIVGRISMDYTTIDLTNAPRANTGDIVTLFGSERSETISPADWARIKKTHPYDIICSVSPRVPRIVGI